MESALAVLNPAVLEQLDKLSKELAQSNLIPDALKGKPRDVLLTMMTGAELGLGPTQSLRSIIVVKGKPSLSADLMVSLVKQRRDVCEYLSLIESTEVIATYKAKRVGEPEPTTMSFTMQDAQRAGLNGAGGMYTKYPKAMLRARAASGICRAVFPDICLGLYDSDSGELTDGKPTTERDITPAPKGGDAVRAALAAPSSLVVDVGPDETEEKAELRVRSESAKRVKLGGEFDTLDTEGLRLNIMNLEGWLEKYPKNKEVKRAKARLDAMQKELATRPPDEPGLDMEPPFPDGAPLEGVT